MPYLVNGQLVTEEVVQLQEAQLSRDPRWRGISDEVERGKQLRAAAQAAAVEVVLLEQIAVGDPRPLDPGFIEREVQQQRLMGNCRTLTDESQLRQLIDRQFRLQRTIQEMASNARPPTPEEVEEFYRVQQQNFRGSALFRAAHIVKHTDHGQDEKLAREGIEEAMAMLTNGTPFSEVADRCSDCPGKGGDLGEFIAGTMVPEFENAIRHLKPGERTGIFKTSFGFHIAELREKTAAGIVKFEEVQNDIKRALTVMRQHNEYRRALVQVRSRANIRWISENPSPRTSDESVSPDVIC